MDENADTGMKALVASIMESYRDLPVISNIDSDNLPSRDSIIEVIGMLREVLFPGYFGKQGLESRSIEYHLGALLESIRAKLRKQILKALTHAREKNPYQNFDLDSRADEVILAFLGRIPALRTLLETDVLAAFEGDPAAFDTGEIIFSYPGLFAVTVNRLAHELYLLEVPLIPRIMTEYAHSITGIDIHPGATLGRFFFIDHGTGVVIGETTIIGDNVKIYQGVTLGALSTKGGQALRSLKRHPTIEDGVTVYSGASILGGETIIGSGVLIGSNVFITKSVPDRTRVSVKNPELQFKNSNPTEFKQEAFSDWVI